jgi:hypothetical protein
MTLESGLYRAPSILCRADHEGVWPSIAYKLVKNTPENFKKKTLMHLK